MKGLAVTKGDIYQSIKGTQFVIGRSTRRGYAMNILPGFRGNSYYANKESIERYYKLVGHVTDVELDALWAKAKQKTKEYNEIN